MLILLLVLVVLLAAARLVCLQGLIFPVRVASGSMAEALVGPHYELDCADCGFTFKCDAQQNSPTGDAVCPNCGFGKNQLDRRTWQPGHRVLIDRAAYWWRRPRRWDVVALRDRADSDRLEVKRIVGLPGEKLAIRDGDIYVNGRIRRKSLEELRRVAILVHDTAYRPQRRAAEPRWSAALPGETAWRFGGAAFHIQAGSSGPDSLDWLGYRHRSCFAGPAAGDERPVTDNYGYNQGVSRKLQEVTDLMLRCEIEQLEGAGTLAFVADDGRDRFRLQWRPQKGQISLSRNGRVIASAKAPGVENSAVTVEYLLCDDQVILALDSEVVVAEAYPERDSSSRPTARPLEIGVQGLSLHLERIQVYRDIHYLGLESQGGQGAVGWALGADEYLVLGDNPPISLDSRGWRQPEVTAGRLVGKVLMRF